MSLLRKTALAASAGRVVIGSAMVARPAEIGESWIGETGRFESVTVLTRALGARDAALGGFAVAALASDNRSLARTALIGGVICDLTDLLAMVAVRKRI